jgi:hypothetical protein
VAADVHFEILDERGAEILDKIEAQTGERPYLTSRFKRHYYLDTEDFQLDGFDATLDRITPDWREHLDRIADPG